MKLRIITPERVVFEEDGIEAVYAKTEEGEVGLLPKHIPLVAPLSIGVLRFVKAGKKEPVAVMGGLIRTNGAEVSVLSNAAELAAEIDTVRAEEAKTRAEAMLRQKDSTVNIQRAETALARSMARIKAQQFINSHS